MSAESKAYDRFFLMVKPDSILPNGVFVTNTTGISGWTIPKGVILYNTSTNKLAVGVGTTTPSNLN